MHSLLHMYYVQHIINCYFSGQMTGLIKMLSEQLTEKGKELTTFRHKHNIKIVDERETETKSESSNPSSKTSTGTGLLVSK